MGGPRQLPTGGWAAPESGASFDTARTVTRRHTVATVPSDREIEILALIACGLSNAAIGRRLFISDETVKSHVQSLLAKLGARNRTHAVSVAILAGLLDLDAQDALAADRRQT